MSTTRKSIISRLADKVEHYATWISRNRDHGTVAIDEDTKGLISEAREFGKIDEIIDGALVERALAIEKHGNRHLPSLCEVLLNRPGGCDPDRMNAEYEMPTEARAKMLTENARRANELSWSHILVEELAEVISAKDEKSRRKELLQMIGTAIVWVQDIDNQGNQSPISE